MINKAFASVAIILAIFVGGLTAHAHTDDQGYIYFEVTETALTGRFEVAFSDIAEVIDVDADGDGVLANDEVAAKLGEIFAYLQGNTVLSSAGTDFQISQTKLEFRDVGWEKYAKVYFDVLNLNPVPKSIDVTYNLFFDALGTDHAGFVIIDSSTRTGVTDNEADFALILTDGNRTQTLSLVGKPVLELLVHFVKEGIRQIWLGLDHVLFLFTLLIPAVMVLANARWVPSDGVQHPATIVLKMVIAFAIGHSITLALGAFDIVRLPVWVFESIIALSIAYVAFSILVPRLYVNMVWVVLVFGLFHGFGLAHVLGANLVEPNQKLVTLIGFNIGIEIGQIAIVVFLTPILFILRDSKFYDRVMLKIVPIVLLVGSLIWFEERAFDLMGPVFGNIKSIVGT